MKYEIATWVANELEINGEWKNEKCSNIKELEEKVEQAMCNEEIKVISIYKIKEEN